MATIVYQKDKRSGITYAYQSVSYWDKEKKQSRAKRTLIGRVDRETGEIVPTDGEIKRNKMRIYPLNVDPRQLRLPIDPFMGLPTYWMR